MCARSGDRSLAATYVHPDESFFVCVYLVPNEHREQEKLEKASPVSPMLRATALAASGVGSGHSRRKFPTDW